ncbi:MAG: nucleotidyltransferase family protein [Cenarchaeum sp. SB0665_bin_23]|nr:nucleotidyltransferase family protein [Cenarchaeum sp. SB0667_bin_13]MXY61425.1 nucleotidyltransferase family protein [Cenarchaeum sp. SB0665_bin_23]MXZ93597.1 nucleotidyltransferase family protein [Cenarchaeum sp. SB0666_bin_15]MYB47371.1 nucleotidyltransferase family protein [Cenarchaeum sp. SB0662_bin_33]MYC78989.1 nucleotidyltransferase family protein [Cenarchaeum sp. SB0661_bin_35]MYD58550.1 nucleotidyltransferase family protein [Cenarchaeum sp. SB0678_bin_8]MYG33124.1 nucleotidyltran
MKAVIMAGGQGTRARPFTEYFPKTMFPINGKPIIQYITDYLESFDIISDIIIITDLASMGAQIQNHYSRHDGKPITFVQDGSDGTGGDLRYADVWGDFVLWFSDNLCALDIPSMSKLYQSRSASACVATRSLRREETGFATVNEEHVIQEFREKPVLELPYHECLGIYVLGDYVMQSIREKRGHVNLSYDILEGLSKAGTILSYDIGTTPWADIESPTVIHRQHNTIQTIIKQMESASSAQKE